MEVYTMLISMLGGLALFLYGMEIMGDGLKASSAGALKKALEKVTSNPVKSFILGCLITAVIQSSTATIVLVVGLIGAGVLTLKQSVGIVMGANVGTTITGQIIRLMDRGGAEASSSSPTFLDLFTPELLAPLAAVIGIILIMFIKKGQSKNYGLIAIGFGILFIGLINMTAAMRPLQDSEAFKDVILKFSNNPFMGLLIGTVITSILQSSSASVGIIQTLTMTGVINFNFSYAYVIGAALGTCITTAIVCSIGTKNDAKRVGIIHIIFNVIGGALFMGAVEIVRVCGGFPDLFRVDNYVNGGFIADFQTVFKLATAIVLLPFTPMLIKASRDLIKDKKTDEGDEDIEQNLGELNQQLLVSPAVALESVKHLLGHMCEYALKNYNAAVTLFDKYDEAVVEKINERETLIDKMADATNNYLVTLAPHIESDRENAMDNYLLQTLTEFERIGDIAVNLADSAGEMIKDKQDFSKGALAELKIMTDAVRQAIELSYKAFIELDYETAAKVEPLEEVIDDLNELLRKRHIERLKAGKCTVTGGIYFFDILINLERLGDQCSDVAVYVLGMKDENIVGNEHTYIDNIHKEHDEKYAAEFAKNTEIYIRELEKLPAIGK